MPLSSSLVGVFRRGVLALAGLSLGACSLSPTDGQLADSRTVSLTFEGASLKPSQTIRFEVHSGGATPAVFASTTTRATPTRIQDLDYFQWSTSAVIPSSRWVAGTTGYFARIRTRLVANLANGSDSIAYTFPPDWSSCYSEYPAAGDFVVNCQSPHSPDAYVYTRDFPTGVDLIVKDMRPPSSSPNGKTTVVVRNNGRFGKVTGVACFQSGRQAGISEERVVAPGQEVEIELSYWPDPAFPSTCSVGGVSESGAAEPNTGNNSRVEYF
ncbi:hypothetical protein VZQ01_14950 [Myxococcus faecalis]|uniref:hypothetical protein n=1 Tax=Myxococcus faecalis TaxID=3115646 RepID=UPI003CED4F5F